MPNGVRKLPAPSVQLVLAAVAGITGAWFLIFLGTLLPSLYGFSPVTSRGAVLLMFAIFGLTFGFYLGQAMMTRMQSLFFVAAAFVWVFISLLINFPPLFYGSSDVDTVIVLVLPFLFSLSIVLSNLLRRGTYAEKAFTIFSSKVSLYLLWVNIGYVYMYPMFQKFSSEPSQAYSPNTLFFFIIAAGWLFMVVMIYFVTQRLMAQPSKQ